MSEPVDITIFGGTGYAGGHIAREAVDRGHRVTSYSRHQPSDPIDGVTYLVGTLVDPVAVSAAAEASDVVVVATHGADVDGRPLVALVPDLATALTGRARLGVVGGAGSSLVAEGGDRLLDTPEFHEEWKSEATAHALVLDALRAEETGLDWFYVSPAALFGSFAPGETTGRYRTGGDVLVTQDDGSSEISGADFALAFVDEIEAPAHSRQRFTVGH